MSVYSVNKIIPGDLLLLKCINNFELYLCVNTSEITSQFNQRCVNITWLCVEKSEPEILTLTYGYNDVIPFRMKHNNVPKQRD